MTDPFGTDTVPSLSFKDAPVGRTYVLTVTGPAELRQSRDFETGEPAVWDDGNPKMSAVVRCTKENGEPVAVWAAKPSALFAAIVAAQRAAGGEPLAPGGKLTITYTGDIPNARNPRLNAAKQYSATYAPPKVDPFATAGTTTPPAAQAITAVAAAPAAASVDAAALQAALANLPAELRALIAQ